jgi:hypothetical protein
MLAPLLRQAFLENAFKTRSWHDIVTLDESWFYLNTTHERIWLAPGDTEFPENAISLDKPSWDLCLMIQTDI